MRTGCKQVENDSGSLLTGVVDLRAYAGRPGPPNRARLSGRARLISFVIDILTKRKSWSPRAKDRQVAQGDDVFPPVRVPFGEHRRFCGDGRPGGLHHPAHSFQGRAGTHDVIE